MGNFTRKYRPREFDEILGNHKIIEKIKTAVETETLQHMIFCGMPGIGKTTTLKVLLSKTRWEHDTLNASDERGIDTIRNYVVKFASTKSFNGKKKILVGTKNLNIIFKVHVLKMLV